MEEENYRVEMKIRNMLPDLSSEESSFIKELPDSYLLEVPFVCQEEKHWSGAAVVQMISKFFGIEPDTQREIVEEAGWTNWEKFDHSTFREKLARYFLRKGFLFSQYYPSGHIAPKMKDGITATDFIRANPETISKIDFEYLKALIVSREAPVIVRLHFTAYEYPMPELMIERLDVSGHSVVIIGYDDKGFIIHDPWNKEVWGGTRGGSSTRVSYETLSNVLPMVDCSKDCEIAVDRLKCTFLTPRESVYQGKEITMELVCEWPGLTGILGDWYKLNGISAKLSLPENFSCSELWKEFNEKDLIPGQKIVFEWQVKVGNKEGSFPVEAEVIGNIRTPEIPWERHSEEINAVIKAKAPTRICVFEKDFLLKYGTVLK